MRTAMPLGLVGLAWGLFSLWTVSLYDAYRESQIRSQASILAASASGGGG